MVLYIVANYAVVGMECSIVGTVVTVVAWYVCVSLCWSRAYVSRAKTAELIDMPCGCKFMGPKEPCSRWRPRSSRGRDIFGVGISRPVVKYREYTACGQ